MSVDSDIHSALMAQVETISGYTILWPRKGGSQPAGEHLRVSHLPNDNEPLGLADTVMARQGFLVITHVTSIGPHEAPARKKCGLIVDTYFPRGQRLTANGTKVIISGYEIRPGRQEGGRWETPIRIAYFCKA